MTRASRLASLLLLAALAAAACSDPATSPGPAADDVGADTAADAPEDDTSTDTPEPDVAADVPEGDTPVTPGSLDDLILNEVAATGDPADWVELYNNSDRAIDLSAVALGDDPTDATTAVPFGAGARIEPRDYLVIYLDPDGFPGFRLGSDEAVALFAPDGAVLDAADWDEGQSPDRASWGRFPDLTGDFKLLLNPTPGAPNVDNAEAADCGDSQTTGDEQCDDANPDPGDGCAPGCRLEDGWTCTGAPSVCQTRCGDSVVAGEEHCDNGADVPGDSCSPTCRFEVTPGDVVLNEVVARDANTADWVELLNTGAATVDLSGWVLADSQGLDQGFTVPAGVRIAPGTYRVFERDAADSFTFGLAADDAVFLYDRVGQLVDYADWRDGEAPDGSSFGRRPNGTGAFQTLTPPTRGAANR